MNRQHGWIMDETGCLIAPLVLMAAVPVLIYESIMESSGLIRTKPVFRKPTINFLEKQLGRVYDARMGRDVGFLSGMADSSVPCRKRYEDLEKKEKEILQQLVELYEQANNRKAAENSREKLNYLMRLDSQKL